MITPSWFSGSWRSFLYSSSMYSYHLFLISSASVPFLFFIVLIFAWNVPLVSLFLKEISSLFLSIVFLYYFALITEEGFLISPCCSLDLCIKIGISFLFSFAFHFSFFSAICKASSDNHFAFLHFFFLGITGGLDHSLLYNVFTTNASSVWEEILFKLFFLLSYFWLC